MKFKDSTDKDQNRLSKEKLSMEKCLLVLTPMLASLLVTTQKQVKGFAAQIISKLIQIRHFKKRLEQNAIPISIKFNFELTCKKYFIELEKFKQIKEKTVLIVEEMKIALQGKIAQVQQCEFEKRKNI